MTGDATPAKKTAAKKTASTPVENPVEEPSPAIIWERLTAPFPEDWIEKLPKQLSRDDRDKSACRQGTRASADGHYCGGWHARAVHLDYVGHAGITMRLNDVLGPGGWDFRPMAATPEGLPILTSAIFYGQLTIRVRGDGAVTKWDMAANFNGPQEAYGDALRRCAMRFGIGTYLWSKSDHAYNLAKAQEPPADPEPASPPIGQGQPPQRAEHVQMVVDIIQGLTEAERQQVGPWWENAAKDGHLPARTNLDALTPPQAIWIRDTVAHMRQVAADARQADGTPETPGEDGAGPQ
jgi:hypothetical protein